MGEAKSMSLQTVPQIHVPETFYGLVFYKELSKQKKNGGFLLCYTDSKLCYLSESTVPFM